MKISVKFALPTLALLTHWYSYAQVAAGSAAAAVASGASGGGGTGTTGRPPIFTWAVIFGAGMVVGYLIGVAMAKKSDKQG
jgi:uncharacterized membrane protein YfcA